MPMIKFALLALSLASIWSRMKELSWTPVLSSPSGFFQSKERRKMYLELEEEPAPTSPNKIERRDQEIALFLSDSEALAVFQEQIEKSGLKMAELENPKSLEDLCWKNARFAYSCQEAGARYERQSLMVNDPNLQLKHSNRVLEVFRRACGLGLANSCAFIFGRGDELDAHVASINLRELCHRGAVESCDILRSLPPKLNVLNRQSIGKRKIARREPATQL